MLDDLRKNIQQNQRWALKDWVEGAKLLVIATDVHGLKGDDYVQFAVLTHAHRGQNAVGQGAGSL